MIALGAPLTIGELTETVKQGVGGGGASGLQGPPRGAEGPPGGGRRPPRGGTPPKEKFPRPLEVEAEGPLGGNSPPPKKISQKINI